MANCYTAIEQDVEVVPVLNKIDLPSADPERVVGGDRRHHRHRRDGRLRVSAKNGIGIDDMLEAVIAQGAAAEGQSRRTAARR